MSGVKIRVWGLLIAHQCSAPRVWQEVELNLLQRLSIQLAIALQQSIAHQQLQQELAQRQRAEEELKQLNQLLETKIAEQTQELRDAQQFLQTLLDTLPVYVFWKNTDSIFRGCNQPLADLMGLSSPHEFVNRRGLGFSYTEEELQLYRADDLEVIRSGQPKLMIEETLILPNGKKLCIEIHKAPLRDYQGNVIGVVGIFQDISDRKRTEEALQLSEERFRNAFENTPVGMSLVSLEGNIIRSNNAICNFLQYSKAELINLHFREITHPDDLNDSVNFIAKILAGEMKNYCLEKRYLTKKKQVVWGLVSVSLIRDKQHNPLHFVVQVQDITARKQAEEDLHNERLRLQLALDASKMGTWSRTLGSDQLVWSERSQQIFGFQPGDFPGNHQTFLAMIHPEERAQVLRSINRAFETRESYHLEYRIIRLDGEVRWISVLGIMPEMLPLGERQLIGVMSDISDRKNYEFKLQQKNVELETLLQLREETLTLREDMSNMIVHDLRNPLSTIILSTGLLRHHVNQGAEVSILSKKVEQILGSAQRLQNMIDSLLLMAKLESGKILLRSVETDLHTLGMTIINDFELMANSHKIKLRGQLPKPGQNVIVDETILRRVIDNLISNALKFSPSGSQVRLNIEYLPKNHFRVSVADNGPGISEEKQQTIFDKFEIGTVKQNVSQLGLGLAFCKMAVEAQGGTLAIAPNQPQGSIFTVEI